ncbi:MAG: hypothetical protein ACOVKS_05790 [Aquimonas sp.]
MGALGELTAVLSGIAAPRRFAVHSMLPAQGLHLESKGEGELRLPIDALVARTLCESAELALHGCEVRPQGRPPAAADSRHPSRQRAV